MNSKLLIGLMLVSTLLLTGCTTGQELSVAKYSDEYVHYGCAYLYDVGAYGKGVLTQCRITNLKNYSIKVESLFEYSGTTTRWIKTIQPNEYIDLNEKSSQISYMVYKGTEKLAYIQPNFKRTKANTEVQ